MITSKKEEDMKKIFICLAILLLISVPVFAEELKLEKKAGDNTVTLKFEKNPPAIGKNKVVVEIRDASGKIVKDAKVGIKSSMPDMASKNMFSEAAFGKNGYETTLNLPMSGVWETEVKININNQEQSVKYNVDVK